jgi:phosphatidylglycerophosphatase A
MPAPGTWGSIAGLFYFAVFFAPLYASSSGSFWSVVLGLAGAYGAVALCGEAEFRLAKKDPGEVILDEFVAMPFCFLDWNALHGPVPKWAVLIAGLAVFRLFDITKPLFINRLQDLPGGWGVVVDDLAAALVTCAVLHAAKFAWVFFGR